MKIAVTYENGEIYGHFGHTEQFKIYEVVDTNGSGHGALVDLLSAAGVNTLICGGIGGGAQAALHDAGIELYAGITGNADRAMDQFLCGTLNHNPNANCNHHHGGSEHNCSDGGCGQHSCH